jgi:hypothetical protein
MIRVRLRAILKLSILSFLFADNPLGAHSRALCDGQIAVTRRAVSTTRLLVDASSFDDLLTLPRSIRAFVRGPAAGDFVCLIFCFEYEIG